MPPPRVRLDFSAMLWRATLLLFALNETALWLFLVQRGVRRGQRFGLFVSLTPQSLFLAFLVAATLTVVADLLVRLVVRPLVRLWHEPRVEEAPFTFHLAAHERVLLTSPARMSTGRLWPIGTLVLTDRRLWFFPNEWDAEPWVVPHDQRGPAWIEPGPDFLAGYVVGFPERLALASGPSTEVRFVLPDPRAMADQLARPRVDPAV